MRLRRGLRYVLYLVVGGALVLPLAGCDGTTFCGANPILSYLFCRADDSPPVAAPDTPAPPPPPDQTPSVRIEGRSSALVGEPLEVTGSWSDDGTIILFEWD